MARELKSVDKCVQRIRVVVSGADVKSVSAPADRERVTAVVAPILDATAECRATLRQLLAQCLSGTQKLHIGEPPAARLHHCRHHNNTCCAGVPVDAGPATQ